MFTLINIVLAGACGWALHELYTLHKQTKTLQLLNSLNASTVTDIDLDNLRTLLGGGKSWNLKN